MTDTKARTEADAKPAPGPGRQFFGLLKEVLFVVVGAIIVSTLLKTFVLQMFSIPSRSMESTLLVGDRVVVEKLTTFERGDVVVFADPAHWLAGEEAPERGPVGKVLEFIGVLPDTSTGHLIKRVIGTPGDKVVCCDSQGRITVNGYALDESGYLYSSPDEPHMAPSTVRFEVVVPKDRLFVMGDHRSLSADSRCHLSDIAQGQPTGEVAFVPIKDVVGPAWAIAYPFDRAKVLHVPATFAGVPAPGSPAPDEAVIKPEGVTC